MIQIASNCENEGEILENLEILEILENSNTVENKGESDHFLEMLENFRDFRDSGDSFGEKTPFVMTPFSGPDRERFFSKLGGSQVSEENIHETKESLDSRLSLLNVLRARSVKELTNFLGMRGGGP